MHELNDGPGMFDDIEVEAFFIPEQAPLAGVAKELVEMYQSGPGGYQSSALRRWGITERRPGKGWKSHLILPKLHTADKIREQLSLNRDVEFIVSRDVDGELRTGARDVSHGWITSLLEDAGYQHIGAEWFDGRQLLEVFRKTGGGAE